MNERLKEVRLFLKFTQKEMAKLLGISQNAYSYIENGKVSLTDRNLNILIEKLDINPDFLKGITKKYFIHEGSFCRAINFADRNQKEILNAALSNYEPAKAIPDHKNLVNGEIEKRVEKIAIELFNNQLNRMAMKTYISQSKLRALIKGDEQPDYGDLMNIAQYTNVDLEWLITGNGRMIKQKTENLPSALPEKTRPRIPYTAAAGSLSDAPDGITMKDCEQIPVVHQFPSYDFTMLIKGDSMSPKYESGDEVACRKIDQNRYIQWGKVHVLDTTQGIIIKRVYEDGDKIRCVSYNKEYADFSIPKEDIYSMSLVVGVLSITEI